MVVLYMCFYLKLSEFPICSYAARWYDSESTLLSKQYMILLPCFLGGSILF